MKYHFVVGDLAARPLIEAVAAEESLQGEIVIIKDVLSVGPLQTGESQSFSQLRAAFWDQVTGQEAGTTLVNDLERILEVSNALQHAPEASIWFWMSPLPADVCAYYFLLHYLAKHRDRFWVVNIAGLPFLDDQGKLFFPQSIAETSAKELIKARKLARLITLSELELERETWQQLVASNHGIRIGEGGKKLSGHSDQYYDQKVLSMATLQPMKASKLVHQALQKHHIPTGDRFLGWRVKEMIKDGQLYSNSDLTKALKEIEVSLPGNLTLPHTDTEQATPESL